MVNWIRLPDFFNNAYVVKEVQCPVCKLHRTYIGTNIPSYCYICNEKRE